MTECKSYLLDFNREEAAILVTALRAARFGHKTRAKANALAEKIANVCLRGLRAPIAKAASEMLESEVTP